MLARDAMSSDVKLAHPEDSIEDTAVRMQQFDIGMMPVVRDESVIGAVTDRDIVTRGIAKKLRPAQAEISDIMTNDVASCYDDQDIDEVVQAMKNKKVRRIVVLNRDDKLAGLISLGDIAGHMDVSMAGEILEKVTEPPK